ncbi:Metal-pseudopaline+receptor+CntO [Methylocapsa aurea]|uniref:TonB-dependent siderophore receptor n=1 Tax=Methylocapsa aurea TaxID=663610 RepID=UPI003D18DBDB
MKTKSEPLGAAAAFGLLAIGGGVGAAALDMSPAWAALDTRSYEISSGPVTTALQRFAEKSGAVLIYDSALARGKTTAGFKGDATVTEALGVLLSGTGLSYSLAPGKKSVAIMLAQNEGVRNDAGAEALPAIDIGAERPATRGEGSGKPVLTPQNSYVTPVVSTGTKTDTPVMNTPVNVQAVTQKAIEDRQAITLGEALGNVSGVFVGSTATTAAYGYRTSGIFIRGFLTKNIYRDGFRMDGSGAGAGVDLSGDTQLANVESIEVLKGPAAILYGLSEPGGIVNATTSNPSDTPHYSITQQIGSLALYRTSVGATGPLNESKSLLYRLDTSYENNGAPFGSFIDLTHSQNVFVAPVIKWVPDEATWVKAELQYNNAVSANYSPIVPLFNGSFITIPRNVNYGESSPYHTPSIFAALTLSHRFDNNWSIKQRVAFDESAVSARLNLPSSLSGGANPTLTRITADSRGRQTTFSTNIDIVGHFDLLGAKHTLLLGGDFYRLSSSNDGLNSPFWGTSLISLANPVHPGVPGSYPVTQDNLAYSRQDTAGLYLQDEIALPYDFHVMAGLRYQKIHQWSTSAIKTVISTAFFSSQSSTYQSPDALDEDRVTPRFGLLWRPREWVSLYGNYTEGFSPNKGFVYPGTLSPPSGATSWEAGAKFEFFEGRLRATVDYYDLVKTNVAITDPNFRTYKNGVCAAATCNIIAGEAHSSGPEVDIQGELLPGLNVSVAYTNQDVRISRGTSNSDGLSGVQPGQRFPNVPRNLARLSATYDFQDASLKGLKIGAFYTYHGSQPILDGSGGLPGAAPLLASWGTVDLMAGYSFDLDGVKTTAQVNIANLLDQSYYNGAGVMAKPTSGFSIAGYRDYGAPFSVRGSLRFEF